MYLQSKPIIRCLGCPGAIAKIFCPCGMRSGLTSSIIMISSSGSISSNATPCAAGTLIVVPSEWAEGVGEPNPAPAALPATGEYSSVNDSPVILPASLAAVVTASAATGDAVLDAAAPLGTAALTAAPVTDAIEAVSPLHTKS